MSDQFALILSAVNRGYKVELAQPILGEITIGLGKTDSGRVVKIEQTVPRHHLENDKFRNLLDKMRKDLIKKEAKVKAQGQREVHVLHPVQKDGVWKGAELDTKGYFDPFDDSTKPEFQTQEACQKACDEHNQLHGFSKKDVKGILAISLR